MNFKIFFFFVVVLHQQHSTNGQEIKQNLPINLTVLYKPLHHLSRTFIIESLKPLLTNINTSYLQLQLIPAGDSVISGVDNTTVQCASPDQCTAAQFHSCALDLYLEADPILTWNFIYCTVKNKLIAGVFPAAQRCAKEEFSEARWNKLYQGCVSTGTGNQLLAENVRKTAKFFPQGLPAVPTVLLNDQMLSKAADLDTGALQTSVCRLIPTELQPDYCQLQIAKKIPVRVFYESTSDLSKVFFRKQTDPWCVYLEEMITLELYPAGNVPLLGPNKTTSTSSDSSFGNRLLSVVNERYFNHLDVAAIDGDFMDGYMRTLVFHTCFYNASQWKGNNGMTEQDFISAAQHCAEMSLPLDDWFNFVAAVKSKEGEEIYSKVVSYTEKFKADNGLSESGLTSIPWVTIGTVGNSGSPLHSRQAANDLFLTVCSLYPLPSEGGVNRPIECTPVEIKVFYSAADTESSADFLLNQLPEVFWRRRQRIDLTLIPYIELPLPLNESLTAEEVCQQNETVCTLNTAHACAVKMYFEAKDSDTVQWDGKNQTLGFISCTFEKMLLKTTSENDVTQIVEHCANAHFISADLLSYCSQSAEGRRYLEEMRNRTLELQNLQNQKKLLAHPLILINGQVDNRAKTNLKAAICEAIVGDKMEYCHEKEDNGGGSTPSSSPAIFFSSFFCLIVVPIFFTTF